MAMSSGQERVLDDRSGILGGKHRVQQRPEADEERVSGQRRHERIDEGGDEEKGATRADGDEERERDQEEPADHAGSIARGMLGVC